MATPFGAARNLKDRSPPCRVLFSLSCSAKIWKYFAIIYIYMKKIVQTDLDELDRRILAALQVDGTLSAA
ncbi:MAG: hypothetical protein ACO3IN_08325, partial [Steroidobacteraceae bacterium]